MEVKVNYIDPDSWPEDIFVEGPRQLDYVATASTSEGVLIHRGNFIAWGHEGVERSAWRLVPPLIRRWGLQLENSWKAGQSQRWPVCIDRIVIEVSLERKEQ